jgi:dTDP-4-amino-4,6-dideoxygalactose transaminase
MPAYHHGVEVEVLKARGLKLRYYRIDDRLDMDLEHVRKLLGPRTRLLYVIHYLGYAQPISEVRRIVADTGLLLFEDCALALYTGTAEGPVGSVGDAAVFCLYKSIPVPHGGVMVLRDPQGTVEGTGQAPTVGSTTSYLANQVLDHVALRWPGGGPASAVARSVGRMTKRAGRIEAVERDTEHFDESLVDLGVAGITRQIAGRIDSQQVVERRRQNFRRLDGQLGPGVRRVRADLPPGMCPLSLAILVRDRSEVHRKLHQAGVGTITMWAHDNPDIPVGTFPEVDFLRRHLLELPIHQGLSNDDIDYVARLVTEHALW